MHARKALAEIQKMHNSAALQLKLFGSEAAFFVFRLKPFLVEPDLRLKTEATHKKETQAIPKKKAGAVDAGKTRAIDTGESLTSG